MKRSYLIQRLGSQIQIARTLDVAPSSVHAWKEELPDSAVGRIARLRPDLLRAWWAEQEQGATADEVAPAQTDRGEA
ncbi:hypothetical protein [Chitinimonas lacunae]|uniref:Helix-turn-helix domain-containing protein n=1 Tax=Chitinimonas lacunae TaxID=1963018 RepID=A0ABV8MWF3_9NEIS